MAGGWDDYSLYGNAPYNTGYEPGLYSLGGSDPYLDVPDPVGSWEPAGQSNSAESAPYDWQAFGQRLGKGYVKQTGFAADTEAEGPGFPGAPRQQGLVQGRQASMDQLMAGLTGSRNPWQPYKPYGDIYGQTKDQQQILRILGLAR